jgi:uncharacterized protein
MENIYNYKTAVLGASFKDADSKTGIVTGYFSAFGNKDSDGDIIVSGAFKRTIEERGPASNQPRIKHLRNQKTDSPIGKILTLKEDSQGLYYESHVGTHTIGKEFIKMVESDLITEHSIGYRVIKWEKDQSDSEATKLTELQLWEGSSLTAWGANHLTPLTGMKADNKENFIDNLIRKYSAIERYCRNTDSSDENIELLILANKQLQQIIIDLTKETTTPAQEGAMLPDNKCDDLIIAEHFKTVIYSRFKSFVL